jgi:hypothetical protein
LDAFFFDRRNNGCAGDHKKYPWESVDPWLSSFCVEC